MLSAFKSLFPQPKVRTLAALQQLLDREAAFVAQRSIVDFVRNELGHFGRPALEDPRFRAKLAVSRWEGYGGTLADMVVLCHALLKPTDAERHIVNRRLGDLYADTLATHPLPDHRPQGWNAEIEMLRRRLAERTDAPADPQADATATALRVFDTLPIEPRDPVENRMVLANAFAFGLVAFSGRLRRLLDTAPLRAEIAAAGP